MLRVRGRRSHGTAGLLGENRILFFSFRTIDPVLPFAIKTFSFLPPIRVGEKSAGARAGGQAGIKAAFFSRLLSINRNQSLGRRSASGNWNSARLAHELTVLQCVERSHSSLARPSNGMPIARPLAFSFDHSARNSHVVNHEHLAVALAFRMLKGDSREDGQSTH